MDIAVIGTGISGMAAAWLLSGSHRVTIYESAPRLGGHSCTIGVPVPKGLIPVDMGFIVYNEVTYPNLTALFRHLDVPTHGTDMSFGISLDHGALEYGTSDLGAVFAQKRNLLRPRFWGMMRDLVRFYREAPGDLAALEQGLTTLGAYLEKRQYGPGFIEDHLLPMAAAIWSTPAGRVGDQPAASFIRFCENHGLLKLTNRTPWHSVLGGSRTYVERLTARYADRVRLGCGAREIRRDPGGVSVRDAGGTESRYDHVVIATHSDEALNLLADPSDAEAALLGAIRYGANEAVMHRDPALMPLRRRAWSSWNYLGARDGGEPSLTYWMNKLQDLGDAPPIFVTLNPAAQPDPALVIHRESFAHPLFDAAAITAQRALWSLQGSRRTWFCGAYFGAGFHEDGLQAGLAVAEALGQVRRPWIVAGESGRIHLTPSDGARLVA